MTYASEVLADSPFGYWKLDESSTPLADSSGGGISLTAAGSTGTYTVGSATSPPQGGTSVNYNNGRNSAVVSGTAGPTRPWTMEGWFYPTANDGGAFIHWGQDDGSNGVSLGIGSGTMDSNGLEVIVLVDSVAWKASGYTLPSLNAWYHLVATDDGTNIRIYVNGTLQATVSSSAPVSPSSNHIHIGREDASSRYVVGNIAHVAIYNSALSGTRVTAHYDARSTSATAKSDTDSFTFTDGTPTVTTTSSKADTDTFTATEDTGTVSGLIAKSDTDTFTATDAGTVQAQIAKIATDRFVASELEFLNYTPTPPLAISFAGHRTFAALGLSAPSLATRSRVVDMPAATTTLYARLFDASGDPRTLTGLTVTFNVGTPGTAVQGRSGNISVSVSGTLATITVPGGLAPGVYSCRLTVNSSGAYRSYPTEAITLVVT